MPKYGKKDKKQINVWITREVKIKFDETPQCLNKWEIIDFLIHKWNDDDKLKEEFRKMKEMR